MDEGELPAMTVNAAAAPSAYATKLYAPATAQSDVSVVEGCGPDECTPIKVFCRLRQQNHLEKREGATQCSTVVDGRTLFLRNERCDVDEIRCTFDRVFDVHTTQQEVYEHAAKPLVRELLQGYNCTIFAYGQTGSGKTHTILGPRDGSTLAKMATSEDEEGGIISRVVKDLYREMDLVKRACSDTEGSIELSVSFVEIYMEQIRDLLVNGGTSASASSGGLKIRENAQRGIFIEELSHTVTPTEASMMDLVKLGVQNRAVASTRMNKDSSRSHTILMLNCSRKDALTSRPTRRSTMYIVDLAGSEFVNKTNASGKVLQEAKAINKSLSALSNVIKALVEGKKHVPYRDSKLTRILQDSLGGTAKTCLILAASCSSYNIAETISTLRFGLRAKEIKNPAIAQRNEAAVLTGAGGGSFGSTGGNGGSGDVGSGFKELYQRAMEDVEARNRTIDELHRLLSAKQDEENQHLEAVQPQVAIDDDAASEEAVGDVDSCDEDDDPAQSESKERERLDAEIASLREENRNLVAKLEALELKTSELAVDVTSGRPVLSRRRTSLDSTVTDSVSTLKDWLETDAWADINETGTPPEDHEHPGMVSASTEMDADTEDSPTEPVTAQSDTLVIDEDNAATPDTPLSYVYCGAPCVHRQDAEALSRQIVELKLQLHYLSENTKLALDGEQFAVVMENTKLKSRVEELEFQANLCTVACNQLEMKNRACETRLSNQETHITCLQNSLQEYQALFKQQIVMSQEKCRLLSDELEFYKKLAKSSQQNYQYFGSSSSLRQQSIAASRVIERKSFTLPLAASNSPPSPSKTTDSSPGLLKNLSDLCEGSPRAISRSVLAASITTESDYDGSSLSGPDRLRFPSANLSTLSTRTLASFREGSPTRENTSNSVLASLFARTASSPELRRSSNQSGSPPPATAAAPTAPVLRTSFTLGPDYRSNPMLF